MHFTFSLTVSESKRLIARGIVADPRVVRAIDAGQIALVPGTTNGYVIEELIRTYPDLGWNAVFGEKFDRNHFVAGRTLPHGYKGKKLENNYPAVLIQQNNVCINTAREAAEALEPGDVFIKGVNAINYERRQAAVLIGHPTGGNLGESLGAAIARKVCYLHPVGLEKHVSADLVEVSAKIASDPSGNGPTLWVVPGPIFTEIEAISVLAGVEASPISSGGVGGAEGATWITVFGDGLEKAQELISEIHGEPPYLA